MIFSILAPDLYNQRANFLEISYLGYPIKQPTNQPFNQPTQSVGISTFPSPKNPGLKVLASKKLLMQ